MELTANEGKRVQIETSFGTYSRYAIKTHFVQIGENYNDLIQQYIQPIYQDGDIVSISEKVISLCQKRILYKKDMHITLLAKFLCRFASHSSAGIGVDNVWKMQFAIDHCGKCKIIFAAICGGIGKLLGKKGIFYRIAGDEVRGLDGFYSKAFAEYDDFGIRLPEDPAGVCDEIYHQTGIPVAIVDANDFTCDILGLSDAAGLTPQEMAQLLADNPAGQSAQMTPFVLIRPCK